MTTGRRSALGTAAPRVSRLCSVEGDDEITVSWIHTEEYTLSVGSPFTVPLSQLLAAARDRYECSTVYFVADHACKSVLETAREEALTCGLATLGTSSLTGQESDKGIESVQRIWREMSSAGVLRRTLVIGIGGGVTCDITGFIAGTYMRGVLYALLPTTLMAQVDAAIGGKTGINLHGQKNLIGAFYHPIGVVIDPDAIRSLPDRVLASGLAEVIKVAVIGSPELFETVATATLGNFRSDPALAWAVVRLAIREKLRQLSRDPMEVGDLRRPLNFGHCVGHAIEAELGYDWLHGECVAAGMAVASRLGARTGHTDPDLVARVLAVLERLSLPVHVPDEVTQAVWDHLVRIERVRNGSLHIVVPKGLGATTSLPSWPAGVAWQDVR
ncbi:3-dehydroquinate synthase [Micromonospora sp. AP08]|uniref:3-dehydroquinate synthase family protein n=1 Tax=Micromonospora sp. AP08 TaxID=2604467 RepID=UPI0011DC2ECA|nr:3-dehydroquinate synthase family protein [Micromonospora sp. AP08]TYB39691.1 3-dehydroquinate synthase [Micromonospora sp. AP08]